MNINWVEVAKSAHEHGVWEIIQTIVILSGLSIFILRRRSVPDLNFHIHPSRDETSFPFKLCVDIDNRTGKSVILSSMYFVSGSAELRPDKNAGRDTQTRRLIINFPDDAGYLTESDHLLRQGKKVSTFVPLDPKHSEADVTSALTNRKTGKLICNCTWVESKLTHRLVQKI